MKMVTCPHCGQNTLDAFVACEKCGKALAAPVRAGASDTTDSHEIPEWAEWSAGSSKEEEAALDEHLHRSGVASVDDSMLEDLRTKSWFGYHRPAAGMGKRMLAFGIDMGLIMFPAMILGAILQNNTPTDVTLILWAIIILGPVMYFGFMDGKGGTVGKRVTGIEVVDTKGQPIGVPTSMVRGFVKLYISTILMIGYVIALFDEDGRALHDRVVVTYVAEKL